MSQHFHNRSLPFWKRFKTWVSHRSTSQLLTSLTLIGFGNGVIGAMIVKNYFENHPNVMLVRLLVLVIALVPWGGCGMVAALRKEWPDVIPLRGYPALLFGVFVAVGSWSLASVALIYMVILIIK